ncbi:hypothetical protein HF324_06810 [Chitinophaga oryzae]|uniref:DUF1640 domain-containing protein n=1 Tax=Chitinophaga oryzae TaxID=2725414 RepID=A0AAE6ZFI7_9BACT|nr:hypothetical protein [Chitinophaga oryzae]QJB31090.1 hypothetical protein HF329_07155 [Chitinophaga oryzae]QJB37575.1 hypothetical protein HF324_06810 [Chitinophaga oryzae]
MIATNNVIYNILRKDLHLSEEQTRKLVSSMDFAISEAQADKFATKTEIGKISTQLEHVETGLKEVKAEVTEIRNDLKGLIGTVCLRIGYFIAGAVGILTILNITLGFVVAAFKK